MHEIVRDTKITVNLTRISENIKLIRSLVGPDVAVMPVVKANGYGHGAVGIAPAIMEAGADCLAVATLSEALELKEANPSWPVFIMGHTPDRFLHYVAEKDIIQTVFSLDQVRKLGQLAQEISLKTGSEKKVRVHVKLDTGFHRLGCMPDADYEEEVAAMFQVEGVEVEGIFSHLALVNEEENEKQYHLLTDFIDRLAARGCHFKYRHIADSIACVDYPKYWMNMIRPGALVYGMRGFHKGFLPVQQALTFKTAISQLHRIKAGEGVSYDYLWRAERDSIVATLPFGYADGYPRNLRDKGYVIIEGVKCPIVGVICMDQCIADVTDVPGVCEGMEAVIYGDGTDGSMTIDEASRLAGTNKNDIIARIPARPAREYVWE